MPTSPDVRLYWLCALLAAGIFLIDRAIPLGVAVGVVYVGVVLVALQLRRLHHVFLVAAITSVLVVLDAALSPPAVEHWKALVNRALSLWMIWLTAWLGFRANRAAVALRVLNAELNARVEERTREVVEAGESLRNSEARLRAIVETARDTIISAGKDGRITFFNRAAEQMFGHAAADILDKPLTVLMPERFREAHEQGVRRFISTGQARVMGQVLEVVGLRKDGQEFPVEFSLATWKIGAAPSFTGIIRDVTERKQAETTLKREKDTLQKANQVMLGREERVLELKRQVNDLLKELGRPPQYQA